ncbi:MAG: pilus assembly protein PilM [Candidatus Eisenbacteria sp.]|nr:pilus assembly protein PilM [Candidatus Eisenbacteria bacterium]
MSISTASPPREAVDRRARAPGHSALGVELGDSRIRLARYRRQGSGDHWICRTLELAAVEGRSSRQASRALRRSLRSAGLTGGPVVAALASPAVDVFPVTIDPQASAPRDLQVVRRAEEHLNYPLTEAVLDYAVLPEEIRRPGKENAAVLVFAAPRSLIDEWLGRLSAAGLQLDRLLTPACAMASYVGDQTPGQRFLLIAVAEQATSVAVLQSQHVLLERILPWGLGRLEQRLAEELELPVDQCRTLLTGAMPSDEEAGDADEEIDATRPPVEGAVQEILGPALHELVQEAGSCLGYCDAFLQSVPAAGLIVTGSIATLPPLQRILEEGLGLDVQCGLAGGNLPPFSGKLDAATYATAAGCAFWPKEHRQ